MTPIKFKKKKKISRPGLYTCFVSSETLELNASKIEKNQTKLRRAHMSPRERSKARIHFTSLRFSSCNTVRRMTR